MFTASNCSISIFPCARHYSNHCGNILVLSVIRWRRERRKRERKILKRILAKKRKKRKAKLANHSKEQPRRKINSECYLVDDFFLRVSEHLTNISDDFTKIFRRFLKVFSVIFTLPAVFRRFSKIFKENVLS